MTVVYQSFILDNVHIIQDDMEYYEIYFKENVDEEETYGANYLLDDFYFSSYDNELCWCV